MYFKLKCSLLVAVNLWVGLATADLENYFNFTHEMAMNCKEHLCLHGYSYETFFRVDEQARKPQTPGVTFEMHIAILAASNGHIVLSATPHPEANDPVYEIVVGGGGNKFTELRRNLRRNAKSSAKTTGILSAIDFRAFYIRISEDGLIEFGREGDKVSILSYYDVNPLNINYFSFAAWNGVEAKFLYDCPDPMSVNASSPDSTEVEQTLPPSETLKRDLLSGRVPNLPPGPNVVVKIGVKVTNVRYNAYEGKLSLGLGIVSSWTDDEMAWDPSKFNDTTHLTFRQGQIWKPTFFHRNSDDITVLDSKNPELITMVNSGEATFHFRTVVTTWCHSGRDEPHIAHRNRWPHDNYDCVVLIEAWEPHEKISLETLNETDPKWLLFAGMDNVIQNEWDRTVVVFTVPSDIMNSMMNLNETDYTHQSDRIMISIWLKRKASVYNVVFYTPLLVLITFLLMSFWTEPLQLSRVWFYAGCSVVIVMGMCYIDNLIPSYTVPAILVFYITVLMSILVALLIHVLLMTDWTVKFCKIAIIQATLTNKWFRTVFCLPTMKTCKIYETINEGFISQEDDEAFAAPRNSTVEEMQADVTKFGEKEELAEVVDKTLFVVYSLMFAIMLSTSL